jgi:hypothetical protein
MGLPEPPDQAVFAYSSGVMSDSDSAEAHAVPPFVPPQWHRFAEPGMARQRDGGSRDAPRPCEASTRRSVSGVRSRKPAALVFAKDRVHNHRTVGSAEAGVTGFTATAGVGDAR